MDNRKPTTAEWKRFGGFFPGSGPPEPLPSSPPNIYCSSSSSEGDATDIPSAAGRKKSKRRPVDRVVTRLNFDECVLKHRKNQQWVSPKVKRSILRQEATSFNSQATECPQIFLAVEGKLVQASRGDRSERLNRLRSITPVASVPHDVITCVPLEQLMESSSHHSFSPPSYSNIHSQLPLITPMDSISQQNVNECFKAIAHPFICRYVSPVLQSSRAISSSSNKRDVLASSRLPLSNKSQISDKPADTRITKGFFPPNYLVIHSQLPLITPTDSISQEDVNECFEAIAHPFICRDAILRTPKKPNPGSNEVRTCVQNSGKRYVLPVLQSSKVIAISSNKRVVLASSRLSRSNKSQISDKPADTSITNDFPPLSYLNIQSQLPLITPMDSNSQQDVNECFEAIAHPFICPDAILRTPKKPNPGSNEVETCCVQNSGKRYVSPVLQSSKAIAISSNKKDVLASSRLSLSNKSQVSDKPADTSITKDITDSCAILVVGKGTFCKLPVARSTDGGSPRPSLRDSLSPCSKNSTIPSSCDIIPKSPIIRFKKRIQTAVNKDTPVLNLPSPPASSDIVPKSPVISFSRRRKRSLARQRKSPSELLEQVVPKSNVINLNIPRSPIIGRTNKSRPVHVGVNTALLDDKSQFSCGDRNENGAAQRRLVNNVANNETDDPLINESPHTGCSDDIVQNSPVIGLQRGKRKKSYKHCVVPNKDTPTCSEKVLLMDGNRTGVSNTNETLQECNSLAQKYESTHEKVTAKSPIIKCRKSLKPFLRKDKLHVADNGKLSSSTYSIIVNKNIEGQTLDCSMPRIVDGNNLVRESTITNSRKVLRKSPVIDNNNVHIVTANSISHETTRLSESSIKKNGHEKGTLEGAVELGHKLPGVVIEKNIKTSPIIGRKKFMKKIPIKYIPPIDTRIVEGKLQLPNGSNNDFHENRLHVGNVVEKSCVNRPSTLHMDLLSKDIKLQFSCLEGKDNKKANLAGMKIGLGSTVEMVKGVKPLSNSENTRQKSFICPVRRTLNLSSKSSITEVLVKSIEHGKKLGQCMKFDEESLGLPLPTNGECRLFSNSSHKENTRGISGQSCGDTRSCIELATANSENSFKRMVTSPILRQKKASSGINRKRKQSNVSTISTSIAMPTSKVNNYNKGNVSRQSVSKALSNDLTGTEYQMTPYCGEDKKILFKLTRAKRSLIDSEEDTFGNSTQGEESAEKLKASFNDEDFAIPSASISQQSNVDHKTSKVSKISSRVNVDTLHPNDYNISFETPDLSQSVKTGYCKVPRVTPDTLKRNSSSDADSINISVLTEDSPLVEVINNARDTSHQQSLDNVCKANNEILSQVLQIESCSSQENSAPKSPVTITTISDIPTTSSQSRIRVSNSSSFSGEDGPRSPTKRALPTADMDSAKKKKKRQRKDGNAARLQKLLNRQKSMSRIFQHEILYGGVLSNDRGCLLSADTVWEEYGRTLVRCADVSGDLKNYFDAGKIHDKKGGRAKRFGGGQKADGDVGDVPNADRALVLVLDVDFVPNKVVKVNTVLKIFPPWQTLTVSKMNTTFFLNVINVQILPGNDIYQGTRCVQKTKTLMSHFFCPCTENDVFDKHCAFKLPKNGHEFIEVLFPLPWLKSLTTTERRYDSKSQLQSVERDDNSSGTIAEILTNRGQGKRNFKLIIAVQRVFHYKHIKNKESPGGETEWLVLGRDSKGEFCVVSLGLQPVQRSLDEIVLGNVYTFNGLTITKRIHRDKEFSLWAIINSKTSITNLKASSTKSHLDQSRTLNATLHDVENNTEQLFLYVLTPDNKNWGFKKLETFVHSWALCWLKPQVMSLSKILSYTPENNYISFSIIVKILYGNNTCFYVTDASLVNNSLGRKRYAIVNVRPACLVTDDVYGGKVFLFQDVQLYDGQLFVDKYSRVISATRSEFDIGLPLKLGHGLFSQTRNLRPALPEVNHSSNTKDLVTVQGTVLTVDNETAFQWPVCCVCNNDMLTKISEQSDVMFCERCGVPTKTWSKMSLEVSLECSSLPKGNVAVVKLLQSSIVKLLSHSMKQEGEGYNMDLVREQEVGPLLGLVLRVELRDGEMCFVVQEIENQDV